MLKTSYSLNGNAIRPFIILLAAIVEFKYLTYEEFTYLLPLCIGQNEYKVIADGIKKLRDGKCGIDEIIIDHFFSSVISQLKKIAFSAETRLGDNIALSEISPCLVVDEKIIIAAINKELGLKVTNLVEAKGILENNRYKRFERLIDTVFTDENIMSLLEMFANRNDREIQKFINAEADIPTIFEYVLGILWYKISERKGKM